MLMWHHRLWLIDHGATLFFHHSPGWEAAPARARNPFPAIKNHVLLRRATMLEEIDERSASALSGEAIAAILDGIPDGWLTSETVALQPADVRAAYHRYLLERLTAPRSFAEEAGRAR
jgi:hypothetical protein